MAIALSQEGAFGFGIQTKQGEYVAPSVWLPLIGPGDAIRWKKNYVTLDLADGNDYQSSYCSAGEWAEGTITVPMIPGSLTSLLSWFQDRDQDNQGKWASLLLDCVHEVKQITDAKVRRVTIDLLRGQPVVCTIDVVALKIGSGAAAAVTMPTATPYCFDDASFEIAAGGGALAAADAVEHLQITLDNMVEDPLANRRKSISLSNLAGVRCCGSLSRDFIDTVLYADFAAGHETAVFVSLRRGACAASIALPRVLYTESDLGLPGSHEKKIIETVQFIGLGSTDGLTAPVVLA